MPAGKPERGSYSSAGSAAGRGYPKSSPRPRPLTKNRTPFTPKVSKGFGDRMAEDALLSFRNNQALSTMNKIKAQNAKPPKPPKSPRTPMSKTTKRVAKIGGGTAAMGTAIGVAGTGISKTSSSKNTKTPFGKTTTKVKSGKYAGKRVPKGNG